MLPCPSPLSPLARDRSCPWRRFCEKHIARTANSCCYEWLGSMLGRRGRLQVTIENGGMPHFAERKNAPQYVRQCSTIAVRFHLANHFSPPESEEYVYWGAFCCGNGEVKRKRNTYCYCICTRTRICTKQKKKRSVTVIGNRSPVFIVGNR